MPPKRGLGRGLDALIPAAEWSPALGGEVRLVPVEEIRPNPSQPRSPLDPAELEELAQSIRQHGVLQPLILSRAEDGTGYTLVAGERRLEAARLAGLKAVPALLRQVTERERLELALVENLQREDLGALEAAEGYRQLAESFGLSHEEVAARVGKSRSAITNSLRLLRLSPAVRQALADGSISEGHARALLGLSTGQAQAAALQTIRDRALSVRQTEELVRRLATGRRAPAAKSRARLPEVAALEEQLRRLLGTKVTLRRGRRGGRIVIHFYSDEELNEIVDRLGGKP